MNIIQVLGGSIAESVSAVGTALQRLSTDARGPSSFREDEGWLAQFSDASLDQPAARRTVNALFRAATVRL